jgi:hypothetical protein
LTLNLFFCKKTLINSFELLKKSYAPWLQDKEKTRLQTRNKWTPCRIPEILSKFGFVVDFIVHFSWLFLRTYNLRISASGYFFPLCLFYQGSYSEKINFSFWGLNIALRSNKWLFELTWPPDPSDKHIKQNRGAGRHIQGLRCCENPEGKGCLKTEIYRVRLSTTTKLPALPLTLLWHVHAKFFVFKDRIDGSTWEVPLGGIFRWKSVTDGHTDTAPM